MGEKPSGEQHHRALLDGELERVDIDLAHLAGVLVVDAVHHAGGPGGDEVARQDADVRMRHRRVGQALAEGGLDVQADLAGRLLGAFQRGRVGGRQAPAELLGVALQAQLFIDLRARAVHQHQVDAQGRQQGEVLHQDIEGAGLHQLAAERHHEGLASERMHVGRHFAEPSDELRGGEFGASSAETVSGSRSGMMVGILLWSWCGQRSCMAAGQPR